MTNQPEETNMSETEPTWCHCGCNANTPCSCAVDCGHMGSETIPQQPTAHVTFAGVTVFAAPGSAAWTPERGWHNA